MAPGDGPALLCWDDSDAAERAIQHAARILGQGHRAMVLFAYVPTEAARGPFGGFGGPDAPIMGVTDAEDMLERGVRVAREAGLDATGLSIVAERRTSEIIAALAEEHNAMLIVMGQRKRSPLGMLLVGSVAREVLGLHERPVLLVGPDRQPSAHRGQAHE
jgi:nucleotide-binding universal stress UspA family protein